MADYDGQPALWMPVRWVVRLSVTNTCKAKSVVAQKVAWEPAEKIQAQLATPYSEPSSVFRSLSGKLSKEPLDMKRITSPARL